MDEHIRYIEETVLPELRKSLEYLEAGHRIATRRGDAPQWTDITVEHKAMLKRSIATYEAIITRLSGG
jgi:hypothetical protein